MYIIQVKDDNTLSTLQKERIMCRSKLVDKLCFLVNPVYKDSDMSKFTCLMEYILPISKKYHAEILSLSEERYEEFLQYFVPFDTALTSENGDIEIQLTFSNVELDENGEPTQYVRKTTATTITIVPISAWSDIIPDDALNAIDQRIIKTDAQIQALNEIADELDKNKADNIKLSDDSLQLTSNGEEIGNKINLGSLEDSLIKNSKDGTLKVVTF